MVVTPNYIIERCKTLQSFWSVRKKKFEEWYEVLLLTDVLEEEGMESVATNDPRTGYNLAKHLLTSMVIADKIPTDGLPPEMLPATSYLESYMHKRWIDQEKRYRMIGRMGWLNEFISWLLTTGWYSVFAMVTPKEMWAEVWSPGECFPDFGPDGLVEHARIYTMTATAANRKVKQMGWEVPRAFDIDTTFYDHWVFDTDGDVANAVVAGNYFVKKPVKDIALSKVGRLPIFTSPAGGLPDRGTIKGNRDWQKHYGESIIATNEDLNLNYNKMRSFYQQAARSGAQHHWLETSTGDTPIATDEVMSRWGSVLHGQPGEDVKAIQPPVMPVELTNIMFTYRNELERGLFPAALHGNVQQQMSYLAMANIASSAMQVLVPYLEAVKGMRTDVDNFVQDMIIQNNYTPHKFVVPTNMPEPEDRRFETEATVEIPGYLVQRATIARMLNPKFRLPIKWISERMFPEIRDTVQSQANVRTEDALMMPEAIMVDSIIAYREQARLLREAQDIETAKLYEKLAKTLEAKLSPQQPPQPQRKPTAEAPVVPGQEVLPKELTEPLTREMGRET